MASNKYYPEDVLVEKIQSGEYGWLDMSTIILLNGRKNMRAIV